MSAPFHVLGPERADILVIVDHASNHVPADIDLGIDPAYMDDHIALDIGVAEVAGLLVDSLDCRAILGGVSRLVIDYNREPDAHGLLPLTSDGVYIAGNGGVDPADRLRRFHAPYHDRLAAMAGQVPAPFMLSLHSFTPSLRARPEEARPWEIGILYNEDDRAARPAIARLAAMGLKVGDQLPYSGRHLNATMNRHAEAHGRPYLGVEIRQDLIGEPSGQVRWAKILADLLIDLAQSRAF